MGLVRYLFVCGLWCWFTLINVSSGCDYIPEEVATTTLDDGVLEPRARHRLQLLFPLLMRISSRLATLVPTALMGLMGIILFVVFSKKALIISLIALFFSLSDKYKNKNEEIHIHKVHSYDDYNDEEHIHYHHGAKYWKPYYYDSYLPHRRKFSVLPHIPHPIPLHYSDGYLARPFKPLTNYTRRRDYNYRVNPKTSPVLFPSTVEEDTTGGESEEWNSFT